MSKEQDRLLETITDPTKAKILSEFWDRLEDSPIEAVKLVRKWEEVRRIVEQIASSIPQKWSEIELAMDATEIKRTALLEDLRDFRQGTLSEFSALCDSVRSIHSSIASLDEHTLNKLNRVCDMLERLRQAKRDGTFDLLSKLK